MKTATGPVVQIALPSRDLDAAKRFYTDRLGLPLLFETNGMAFFDAGSVRLMVGTATAPEDARGAGTVYFQPENIVAAADALAARGVVFMGKPEVVQRTETTELQLRFFRDPDGNLLALMGEAPRR